MFTNETNVRPTKAVLDRSMAWLRQGLTETEFFIRICEESRKQREYHRTWMRKFRAANPERSREALRRSYRKHVEKRRLSARIKRKQNRQNPAWRAKEKEYRIRKMRERLASDPNYVARKRLRTRILMALKRKNAVKSQSTEALIGCTFVELRHFVETKWKPGMTWANWGRHGWHLDHIRPCNSFDLTDPEQQRRCFHFTNLQPLWAVENLSKGIR